MPDNETTTRFKVDISDLKKGITEANRQMRLANSEFKAAAAGMDDWGKSADGLTAKVNQLDSNLGSQKSILSNLQQQYELTAAEMGEGSRAAQELQIKINNQQAVVSKTEKELSKYQKALTDLESTSESTADASKDAAKGIDDVGEKSKTSAKEADGLSGKLGDLAKKGFAALATAAAGAATAFFASAEATREYREDIGKLQTAFMTAGYSAEDATETYKSFFSVLGEEDRSVEAVNHLAAMGLEQEQLAKWTDICAGVWGTFGDSLPIEGLTEAA